MLLLFVVALTLHACAGGAETNYLSEGDISRLRQLFVATLSTPHPVHSMYTALLGLKHVDAIESKVTQVPADVCKQVIAEWDAAQDRAKGVQGVLDVQRMFLALSVANMLGDKCAPSVSKELKAQLDKQMAAATNVEQLFLASTFSLIAPLIG